MMALWRLLAAATGWFRSALAAWMAGPQTGKQDRSAAPGSIGEWAP